MQKNLFNLERLEQAQMNGYVGSRLQANLDHWICDVPFANPALFQTLNNRKLYNLGTATAGDHEYLGKYLTSASYCLKLSGSERLKKAIDYTVDKLAQAQDAKGYLGGMREADWFVRETAREGEKKYTWDVWGHYHAMYGLLMAYRVTGNRKALEIVLKAAELILSYFRDKKLSYVRCGFTNMAIGHVFALLYEETGNQAYLAFARRVVEELSDEQGESGNYFEGILSGKEFYELPNTRWEGLHAVEAFAVLWRITGETRYREAFERIWRSIVKTDRHNTGGFTSDECAVGNPYDLRGIETCCTVAWLVISAHMLEITKDPLVADEIEMSTFNGIFAAQHPSGRHSTYNTPMIGDKKASIHEIVFQSKAGGPETNCCSVNIGRALAGMAEWGFIPTPEGLYVNYYGACSIGVKLQDGTVLRLSQETGYPVDGSIRLTVDTDYAGAIYLRIPFWSKQTAVCINGEAVMGVQPGSYLRLDRQWQAGDTIELILDMSIHMWIGDRVVAGKAAFYHGPLLLAYDYRFNGEVERPFREINVEGTPIPTFSKEIRYAFSDAPLISCRCESWESISCDDEPAPWLLYRLKDTAGQDVYLCDFVSAGQTGSPYTTWIPVQEKLDPLPLENWQTQPLWGVRI